MRAPATAKCGHPLPSTDSGCPVAWARTNRVAAAMTKRSASEAMGDMSGRPSRTTMYAELHRKMKAAGTRTRWRKAYGMDLMLYTGKPGTDDERLDPTRSERLLQAGHRDRSPLPEPRAHRAGAYARDHPPSPAAAPRPRPRRGRR